MVSCRKGIVKNLALLRDLPVYLLLSSDLVSLCNAYVQFVVSRTSGLKMRLHKIKSIVENVTPMSVAAITLFLLSITSQHHVLASTSGFFILSCFLMFRRVCWYVEVQLSSKKYGWGCEHYIAKKSTSLYDYLWCSNLSLAERAYRSGFIQGKGSNNNATTTRSIILR